MSDSESAALAALQRSRERMRAALNEALHGAPGSEQGAHGGPSAGPTAAANTYSRSVASLGALPWLAPLRSVPGAGPVIDRVLRWWAPHPLRQAVAVLGSAAEAAVQPVAQKHPVALVLGAAAVGALLVVSRPWRLLITPALLASLTPRLLAGVLGQVPRGSWLSLLTAVVAAPNRRSASQPGSAPYHAGGDVPGPVHAHAPGSAAAARVNPNGTAHLH